MPRAANRTNSLFVGKPFLRSIVAVTTLVTTVYTSSAIIMKMINKWDE